MRGVVRHGPPVRRRGSPWPWQSQPTCRTSPACWSAIIVHVSARCSSLFCDVAVADGGSAIQLAVVAWARVSRGDDGGFTGSRRSLCVPFLFAAPWCRAASIAFGMSGAYMRAAPGVYCGTRIQFHLARGELRLQPTTIRVVPSCTWVASLLVRHDRRRGCGQVSASLHISLCTPLSRLSSRARPHAYSLLWLARRSRGSCSLWDAVLGRRARLSPCDRTPMHFIFLEAVLGVVWQ